MCVFNSYNKHSSNSWCLVGLFLLYLIVLYRKIYEFGIILTRTFCVKYEDVFIPFSLILTILFQIIILIGELITTKENILHIIIIVL